MDLADLSAVEAAEAIRTGRSSCTDLIEACIARIEAKEADIQAWTYFDPDHARAQARAADARVADGNEPGPLHGLPVAIKDIIATADMPTEDGTPIHRGRQPEQDATCVRQLREAGAIIMGKSVTTELANLSPGKTRNPHNLDHTPGGSSSGSAAAVASGMVPLALGTQTGGSVVRPASFCGIHGIKPTLGFVSRTGVTLQSHTLDTVGVYGKSLADLALILDVLSQSDPTDSVSYQRAQPRLAELLQADQFPAPRIAFCETPAWALAEPEAKAAIAGLAERLGGHCEKVATPTEMDDILDVHRCVMGSENAHYYGPLLERSGDLLSAQLRDRLTAGGSFAGKDYVAAINRREDMYNAFTRLFESYDAVLCLSSTGPAPHSLKSTGDPAFNSMWTLLGVPTVTVPLLEVSGLPLGAQLVGLRQGEARLLRIARWLEDAVGNSR